MTAKFGSDYLTFETEHILSYTEKEIYHDIKMVGGHRRDIFSIEVVWMTYLERVHSLDIFENTLDELTYLGFCKKENGVIEPGPSLHFDNNIWLSFNGLPTKEIENNQCYSCKRSQQVNCEYPYRLSFHQICSTTICTRARFKFDHIKKLTGRNKRNYNLCDDCRNYLVEGRKDTKYIWPLFFYNMLFGSQDSKFFGKKYHHINCGGDKIWRLIPLTMRGWWYEDISCNHYYQNCTLDFPPSIFEDKTLAYNQFNSDYNGGNIARVVCAMSNERVIYLNVLCPWTCSTSCRASGRISLDIIIQRMLPETKLLLYSSESEKRYRFVHFCSDRYYREDNNYAMIMLNPNWKVKP